MVSQLPSGLTEHDGPGYWGIGPEAIALAVNARRTDDEKAWSALERYYDVQVLLTNYQPPQDKFEYALETLCDAWFSQPLDWTVMFATPDTVASIVAGAAYYDIPSGITNVLVQGQDLLTDNDSTNPIIMTRSDLHGYAGSEASRRLLKSLGIIRAVPKGYELNRPILESIVTAVACSRSDAAYQLVARILDGLGVEVTPSLVIGFLKQIDVTPPTSPPDAQHGCLSVLVGDNSFEDLVSTLFDEEFEDVLKELRSEATKTKNNIRQTRRIKHQRESEPISMSWPLASETASLCALASQRSVPVAAGWLAECEETTELDLANQLADHGFDVRYDDGLLYFDRAYESEDIEDDALDDYNDWIDNRLTEIDERIQRIEQLNVRPRSVWDVQRQRLLEATVEQLDGFPVSPTRFVYTIFDPDFHADSYSIDKYIGESPELEREVEMISRWRQNRPHDAGSFAEIVPEVLNYPLEHRTVANRIRIMSPWTNFAIKEYVGLFKRLLENGIRIQLLFRLPEPGSWSDLKKNLLTRIGDTEGQLELRSYTRYKRYRDHTELRELSDEEKQFSETGIHAKLFIGGDADKGTLLAGSANLMENSFYYNPEAGIQTRNPNLVETATDYFDLVWELAAHDQIPEEAYTGETKFRYYPRVYRPQ